MTEPSQNKRLFKKWDNLLDLIETRKVIPIVGPGLVTVLDGEKQVALDEHLAALLTDALDWNSETEPGGPSLNALVSSYLGPPESGKRVDVSLAINRLLKGLKLQSLPDGHPLLALASVSGFDLFISITFDSLLATAINQVRSPDKLQAAEVRSYNPKGDMQKQDLPSDVGSAKRPVVYHLLGQASPSPEYAVCDEDVLEFMHALQSLERRPGRLFDALKDSHLLILGCGFPDWLARFFLRMVKNQPLSEGEQYIWFVDTASADDPGLASFLKHFSRSMVTIIPESAETFVRTLGAKWLERHPKTEPSESHTGSIGPPGPTGPDMESGAIFLSYAKEDKERVTQIKARLEAQGIEVWLDTGELRAGDDWDLKIRRNIETCSLFVPVVSNVTEQRDEGYFRREWAWAAERALNFAPGVPFVIPMKVDPILAESARVPSHFTKVQWEDVREGVPDHLAARLGELQRAYRLRKAKQQSA